MSKPGIVFMGTPAFAVASLDAILKAGFNVKGVITSPDKPSGRGLQIQSSPVKAFALKNGLKVLQPLKLKDPGFLSELQELKPDLQVIVAFRMLPEEVWAMPQMGTFNLHASLLPQYRGAAPINWAVINGETKTGVTTFFLNNEIDKGSIIYTQEIDIGENDCAGDVHDKLMEIGAQLVVKTIGDIFKGTIKSVAQHLMDAGESLILAPKIFKDNCRIQWNREVHKVHNFVRGLSPHPSAWAELSGPSGEMIMVKIFSGNPVKQQHHLKPGTIITDGKQLLRVAVNDGYYTIGRIQLQGKKQMSAEEFLRGFQKIADYTFC